MFRRAGSALAAVLLAGGLLVGCSGDDEPPEGEGSTDPAPTGSAGGSTAPTEPTEPTEAPTEPALPVPAGVELSAQGSQLEVGETATVAYQVKQGVVGVLDITVTRLEKTTFERSFVGWELDQGQRNANPYFVRATVTNRGETELGGRRTPLYIVDKANTLVESTTFASEFPPCEPGSFPKKFRPGKKTRVCLVFLSPKKGRLTAVSFRPTQEYDPITWTGPLKGPKPPKGAGKG